MPYTHYNTDERNALQAMEGMNLPKTYQAVILGKHLSSIYREINRNGSDSVYTGNEAQAISEQRRFENKPCPKRGNQVLMSEITTLFKKDISPEQISGRLGVLYPDQSEMQASTSTIYTHLYQETAEDKSLKEHFRQKHAKPHKRSGIKERRGQIIDRVSIDERPKVPDWRLGRRHR